MVHEGGKRVLELIVFRPPLLLDGLNLSEPELHADTDQPAIKQIECNTNAKRGRWDTETAN